MKKIYFDDLFLILRDDAYILCEHIPYSHGRELIIIDCNIDNFTHDQLIYYAIQSEKFKKLNLKVEGIPHKLSK